MTLLYVANQVVMVGYLSGSTTPGVAPGVGCQNSGTRLVTFPTLSGVFWQCSNANVEGVVPSSN